jgi:hypothetical protein
VPALAVEQAATYLGRGGVPPESYLNLLRTRTAEMLGRGKVGTRDETVATLWAMSFELVHQENPSAYELLEICACLAPENIPLDLFTKHADLLSAPLNVTAVDVLMFGEAVATLLDYGLVKGGPSLIHMHRLVQAALRAGGVSAASQSRSQGVVDVASDTLRGALTLLRAHAPADIDDNPSVWPQWASLLPHVLAIADRIHDRDMTDVSLADDLSWLLDRAGAFLWNRSRSDAAIPLCDCGAAYQRIDPWRRPSRHTELPEQPR